MLRGFSAFLLSGKTAGEPSLWEELWQYFNDRYFSVDLEQYEHLGFGSGGIVSVPTIIFGLFIGIIIAAGLAGYDKNKLGSFVRALVRAECLSPDQAKTLSELGFEKGKGAGIRSSLKHGTVLRNVVHCVEREQYEADREAARQAWIEKTGSDKDFDFPLY